MVAAPWRWDTAFMFLHFGWKAVVGIVAATSLYFFLFRRELVALEQARLAGEIAMGSGAIHYQRGRNESPQYRVIKANACGTNPTVSDLFPSKPLLLFSTPTPFRFFASPPADEDKQSG